VADHGVSFREIWSERQRVLRGFPPERKGIGGAREADEADDAVALTDGRVRGCVARKTSRSISLDLR